MSKPKFETILSSDCPEAMRGRITPKPGVRNQIYYYETEICPQCPLLNLHICFGLFAEYGFAGMDTLGRPLTIFEAAESYQPRCNITQHIPFQPEFSENA